MQGIARQSTAGYADRRIRSSTLWANYVYHCFHVVFLPRHGRRRSRAASPGLCITTHPRLGDGRYMTSRSTLAGSFRFAVDCEMMRPVLESRYIVTGVCFIDPPFLRLSAPALHIIAFVFSLPTSNFCCDGFEIAWQCPSRLILAWQRGKALCRPETPRSRKRCERFRKQTSMRSPGQSQNRVPVKTRLTAPRS
jgi:hypothetical protein